MPPVNAPAPAPAPPPPPGPAAPANGRLQWFREIVTAVISLSITFVALYMLVAAFSYASATVGPDKDAVAAKTDAFNRQKDVLLYGLALLGAVTGYYLGRVPAELHAQAAQNTANLAQQQRDQAKQDEATTKADVKAGLTQLAGHLGAAAPMAAVAQAETLDPLAVQARADALAQARADLDALLERVS